MVSPTQRPSRNGAVSWAVAAAVIASFAGLSLIRADHTFLFVVSGVLALLAVVLAFRSAALFRHGHRIDKES